MVQNVLVEIQNVFSDKLKSLGVENPVVVLERASAVEFGDYSCNAAMRYAKELKKNPLDLAESLTSALSQTVIKGVSKVEVVKPGFLNMYFDTEVKLAHVCAVLASGEAFGRSQELTGQKWVIEHTSPNPNKAMHLGHLRNNLVGMGIVRLLQNSGAEVTSDAIYNNRGIAIAKLMYGFLLHMRKSEDTPVSIEHWAANKGDWYSPDEKDLKPDLFVTECYVEGEKAMVDSNAEEVTRQMVVDWEAGNEQVWELWEHVLGFAYEGIDRTLTRLGSHWDKVWYEHEHYKEGKEYVADGLEKGVFEKLEDGAILTKLEETYSLPETVVLKKDGTSLYITQDLALTDLKKKTYGAEKLVWVVGPEQSMAFKQLFAVCEQLGIGAREDFTHVTYGYVGLKDSDGSFKKMSSRAGTVVLIDDVIDSVKSVIANRLKEDARHSPEEITDLSEKLALAAVKFSFLRSDRNQDLSFDIDQSVNIHGDSGMYVMYSYVRTQSIVGKFSGVVGKFMAPEELGDESVLVRILQYYPEVIKKAQADLSVHHIAQYLLELSSEFNSWYAKETILDGSDKEAYRVALASAVGTTIKNGLKILGIETVSKI
jgi:arginyl-tRNA synthetase